MDPLNCSTSDVTDRPCTVGNLKPLKDKYGENYILVSSIYVYKNFMNGIHVTFRETLDTEEMRQSLFENDKSNHSLFVICMVMQW